MAITTPHYLRSSGRAIGRYLPIIARSPAYRRADLVPDLVAGAISWAVLTPVAMAYAQMAGVAPEVGLYASIASLLGSTVPSLVERLMAQTNLATFNAIQDMKQIPGLMIVRLDASSTF
jgi:SulP family sulfate permease